MPTRPAPEAPVTETYVVTVGAITLATGRKKLNGRPEVVRLGKGAKLSGDPSNKSIQTFLANRSIAPYVEGQPVKSTSVRQVCRAMGGMDDPVQAPRPDAAALPAPITAG